MSSAVRGRRIHILEADMSSGCSRVLFSFDEKKEKWRADLWNKFDCREGGDAHTDAYRFAVVLDECEKVSALTELMLLQPNSAKSSCVEGVVKVKVDRRDSQENWLRSVAWLDCDTEHFPQLKLICMDESGMNFVDGDVLRVKGHLKILEVIPGIDCAETSHNHNDFQYAPYLAVDLKSGAFSYFDSVPTGGWSDEYKTVKIVLRRIESGTFMMGSPTDEPGRSTDEDETLHWVTLTRPFYLGVFPMTRAQYRHVGGSIDHGFYEKGECRPADSVAYTDIRGYWAGYEWPRSGAVDAYSFIGKLRKLTHCCGFDLPTEAQWEYACRAGSKGPYAITPEDLRRKELDDKTQTFPVGETPPNAWGLYDMHGNIDEWCLDWMGDYSGDATDPKGPTRSSAGRVLRGGGGAIDEYCRSASRFYDYPERYESTLGFRLCCNICS